MRNIKSNNHCFRDDPLANEDSDAEEVLSEQELQFMVPRCSCSECPSESMISKCCQEDQKAGSICNF